MLNIQNFASQKLRTRYPRRPMRRNSRVGLKLFYFLSGAGAILINFDFGDF